MPVLLALMSAVAYGTSDFLAGLASRRANVIVVTLLAQFAAAAVTWPALPFTGRALDARALSWGAIAGTGAWLGTVFLYRGLARGRMSVVGPLSAVFTVAGSAVTGIALGDRPTALEVAGIGIACVAVGLVSIGVPAETKDNQPPRSARGVLDAAAAGAGFTLLFVALNRAGDGAGLWPVAVSQSSGLVLAALLTASLVVSRHIRLSSISGAWKGAIPAGILGGAATIAYFYATQLGLLTISAVLTSLYPAATVALAVLMLRERLRPLQGVGLSLAALSIALLASRP